MYYYLWAFFMYKVPCIIWVFFMYQASYIYYGSILCIAPPILHKMVPYIWSVMRNIMGQSYVHRLLWDLTLVHKMVPYIECHMYYYKGILCTLVIVGLVLLLYIRWSLIYTVEPL